MSIARTRPVLGLSALLLSAPLLAQPVFMMQDFESAGFFTPLDGYGYTYADNFEYAPDSVTTGNSVLTTEEYSNHPDSTFWVKGRNDSSEYCFKLGFILGTVRLGCGGTCTYGPHVGWGQHFALQFDDLGEQTEHVDMTGATHLTFWAKADSSLKVSVSILTLDSGNADYSQLFTIDTAWAQYSIKLEPSAEFSLPSWAEPKPFNLDRITRLAMSISKDLNPATDTNALYVDDIEVVNWEPPANVVRRASLFKARRGFSLLSSGKGLRVRIPDPYRGKAGVLEVLDAAGRSVERAAFGRETREIPLGLPANAARRTLYFRVLPVGSDIR